jgi:DNA primase
MESTYHTETIQGKPDILEVISRYTTLRQRGREYVGHAACHNDRSPSLRVNAEKQTWYCDPCAVGGDVIRFVEVAEQTDFKGALKVLGINSGDYKPKPVDARKRRAAAMLAAWLNRQHLLVGAMLRE